MEESVDNYYNPTEFYKYSYDSSNVLTINSANTLTKLRSKIAPYKFNLAARNISRELKLQGRENILEIGSGLGLLGRALKNETDGKINFFGIDLVYNSALMGKENSVETIQSDALNLPFGDSSFDAVISTDVLEHINNDSQAAEEIKRVLKPGGKAFLVIADPSEGKFANVEGHINRNKGDSNIQYWEDLFRSKGLNILTEESKKYRNRDWRKIFNLPFLVKLKNKNGFACAFNPINRPGTYIIEKPVIQND